MRHTRVLAAALLFLILAVFTLSACEFGLSPDGDKTTAATTTEGTTAATTTAATTEEPAVTTAPTPPVNNDNEVDAGDIFG